MRVSDVRFGGLVALLGAGLSAQAFADPNLLVNPGAEAGVVGMAVPGWTTTSVFEVVSYAAGGGFPTFTDPGSPNRGQKFFAGGQGTALSTATQEVDLSAFASAIDAGAQGFTLSGWIGGFASQNDHCDIDATFLNGAHGTIGGANLGGVFAAQRASATGMLFRTTSGVIPAGTRSVAVAITMTRDSGSYDDGYADDLSFALGAACPCDLNGDGLVEDTDFTIFVAAYNILDCADPSMPSGCPSDFNGDGVVEDADFTVFVKAYNDLLCP